jgi:hypothetical protein
MPWIPFFDLEPRDLRARRDGRFGIEDCFQHPQVWSEKHPWAPCILRKPDKEVLENHSLQVLWWDVTPRFYEMAPGSAFGNLGTLSIKAWEPFQRLQQYLSNRLRRYQEQGHVNRVANSYEWAIKSTLLRLRDCPLSFRDLVGQVAEFQRLCLDLYAILDYVEIYEHRLGASLPLDHAVDPKIMGCFTSDLEVACKLYRMGLPFWLVRSAESIDPSKIKVKRVVSLLPLSRDIVTAEWLDTSTGMDAAYPTIHHGYSGRDRHIAARGMGRAFVDVIDLEHRQVESSVGKASSPIMAARKTRDSPCKYTSSQCFVGSELTRHIYRLSARQSRPTSKSEHS